MFIKHVRSTHGIASKMLDTLYFDCAHVPPGYLSTQEQLNSE